MAWRLRGFIIYWLSKFRRLKGFPVLNYNDYPNLLYLSIFFLYENWMAEDVHDLKAKKSFKGRVKLQSCWTTFSVSFFKGNYRPWLFPLGDSKDTAG
jgi:hypothetical protein